MISFLKKYGFFTYGKVIPGLTIHGKPAPYPVINERAVRAGAGIMFALALFAVSRAYYLSDYTALKFVVGLFFIDFLMKVIVGTRFSPIGTVANWIVRNQTHEYIGVIQKRFAWGIGLLLSSVMSLLLFFLGVTGPVNLTICSICLTVMFMETSFGICIGCKIYNALLSAGIISTPEYRPACPGNVCAIE